MNKSTWALLACVVTSASLVCGAAHAVTYEVNRSFPGFTLVGTVDVPVGNHVIQNAGAHPFTDIDLLLTVNNTPFQLTQALTGIIYGTGKFVVDATPTTLTFNTLDSSGSNPADLTFGASLDGNRYVLGSNGSPAFEATFTEAGSQLNLNIGFPLVFGTVAIPEPSAVVLAVLALFACGGRCRWSR